MNGWIFATLYLMCGYGTYVGIQMEDDVSKAKSFLGALLWPVVFTAAVVSMSAAIWRRLEEDKLK